MTNVGDPARNGTLNILSTLWYWVGEGGDWPRLFTVDIDNLLRSEPPDSAFSAKVPQRQFTSTNRQGHGFANTHLSLFQMLKRGSRAAATPLPMLLPLGNQPVASRVV